MEMFAGTYVGVRSCGRTGSRGLKGGWDVLEIPCSGIDLSRGTIGV